MKRIFYISVVICILLGLVFVASVSAAPDAANRSLWRTKTRTPTRTRVPASLTPTATKTATPNIAYDYPDLIITSAFWTYDPNAFDPAGNCYRYTPVLLFKVTVKNTGLGTLPQFVVDQDGQHQQTVPAGLGAAQSVDLWFPFSFGTPANTTFPQGSATFTADYTNLVLESNETNNSRVVPRVAFTPTVSGTPRVYCTPTPTATLTRTPTPGQSIVTGSVLVSGGACCVGGLAGSVININTSFSASSPAAAVTQMRVATRYGGGCVTETTLSQSAWEPFSTSKSFPVTVAINWVGFYVTVQYRDAAGNLSGVYCDDISVEGMPAPPTSTTVTLTATVRPGCGTVVVVTSTPTPTFTATPRTATATATTCGPIFVTATSTRTMTPSP